MENLFCVFPIDNSPGFAINRLARELNACLYREFRKQGYDITAQQWGVLSRLKEYEGLHQSELAERTLKNRHNLSRILGQLEKNGLITKKSDSTDKRLLRIYMTQEGKNLHDKLIPIVMETINKIFYGLSQKDISSLKRIHEQVIENIEKFSQNDNYVRKD